jgi:molybdopterin molybdotransferase
MALLPVADALAMVLDGALPCPAERVPLAQAAGRVLAETLLARRTQPPFDASAMDGYAVRSADAQSVGARLRVLGQAAAGHAFAGEVTIGACVRIFTGAPVPAGADTIVIQENVETSGNGEIEILEPAEHGRHIRRRGLDFCENDVLLEAGRLLDGPALSLAASGNHPDLAVVGRPLVAIMATGDELVAPGTAPGDAQIIASNSYGVSAIAAQDGARVLDLGIVADRREAIAEALARAQDAGADVVVTLGGASVGDHDLVRTGLVEAGVDVGFWKIAMRPGKPLMFGHKGAARFIGLPGNPVASLVCSHLFLRPLLARLGGRSFRPDIRQARLGVPMPANDVREDYVRARGRVGEHGLEVTPFSIQDSSMMRVLTEASALIIRAPSAPPAQAGDSCSVLMLREPD